MQWKYEIVDALESDKPRAAVARSKRYRVAKALVNEGWTPLEDTKVTKALVFAKGIERAYLSKVGSLRVSRTGRKADSRAVDVRRLGVV